MKPSGRRLHFLPVLRPEVHLLQFRLGRFSSRFGIEVSGNTAVRDRELLVGVAAGDGLPRRWHPQRNGPRGAGENPGSDSGPAVD